MADATVTRDEIVEVLKTVEDPELFLDVWFLGLIYSIEIPDDGPITISMTFTSPMCPAGPQLIGEIREKVGAAAKGREVDVKVVFSPPWEPSEDVRAMLGLI